MKKIFTLLFAIMASTSIAFSYPLLIDGWYYELDLENYTARFFGCWSGEGCSREVTSIVVPSHIVYKENEMDKGTIFTVTSIGYNACSNFTNLTTVGLPSCIEIIEDGAFDNCNSLRSITIPSSVRSIGNSAFSNCTSLSSINLPPSVKTIGSYAFSGCTSLSSINFGAVTTIWYGAFSGCTSLRSVTIPSTVTSIGNNVNSGVGAFGGCSNLETVTINSASLVGTDYDDDYAGYYHIPTMFGPQVRKYIISDGIEYIGNSAFAQSDSLVSVTFPETLTSIGNSAFSGCNSLTSIDIPNSVTSIGNSTFSRCNSLTSATIGNSVTSIGNATFEYCGGLTSMTIPNSVTSIGDGAFYECLGLTSIEIPNSVTSIGDEAFYNCIRLTSVTIPNSVTSIGDETFYNCIRLTSVTIPNSVTSIGDWAFAGCSSLTSVTIPNSVENIGDNAFYYCCGLDSLVFESESPATLGTDAFDITNNCPLIVPCSAVDVYKTAWPTYADRITCSGTQGTTVTIPTVQDLATAGYDVINKVVLCLRFTDDATVCNDIYAVGTFNNWAKGDGNTEDFANCSKFEPLAGFEGWYAVEFPYSDNVQGKPVQAKSNGAFSWEYQSGDANAWINKGGAGSQTATIWAGYNNEADIYYYSPGCYIYELAYWKNHNSPCANTTHNYTLHMYAPDACEEMKPAIIGNFNNWNTGVAMKDTTDAQGKKMFTITIASDEGLVFKFRDASYDDWSNELQEFLEGYNVWATFSNFMIPAATQDTTIVYDFSDNDKYRFAQCEKEENVIVWLRVPTGAPGYYNGAIEMVVYSADESTTMPMLYSPVDDLWTVELQAKGSDYFSVREANSGDNYILNYTHYYSDSSDEYVWETWGTTFQHYWENGTGDFVGSKKIMLDISNPSYYKWAVPAIGTGIEDIQGDDVQCTKVLRDGQIYILRGEKTYTLTGQEVK